MQRDLQTAFRERFGGAASVYRAPGRVNLIGEHTDYNQGFVMPVAIDLSCWVAIGLRDDRKLVIYSEDVADTAEVDLSNTEVRPTRIWSDYPIGVAVLLQQAGHRLEGANLYIRGEVPLGSGLSSSAALEVSVGYALLQASGHAIDLVQLALLCQRAENEFVGARCGIMDQFTACHGQAGHALMLDCRSLEYRPLRLPDNISLVICNTMVKHALASNEYNLRRSECEEVVRRLAEVMPHVRALRDVTVNRLEENRSLLTPVLYQRARHIVTENDRVQSAAAALETGNPAAFGELMRESHRSLRDDYQVSCSELDVMVEIASLQPGVYGARMTGGGFGGCTINLVAREHSTEFKKQVAEAYHSATGHEPSIYLCQASQGVQALAATQQEGK
jgi:galactokinase